MDTALFLSSSRKLTRSLLRRKSPDLRCFRAHTLLRNLLLWIKREIHIKTSIKHFMNIEIWCQPSFWSFSQVTWRSPFPHSWCWRWAGWRWTSRRVSIFSGWSQTLSASDLLRSPALKDRMNTMFNTQSKIYNEICTVHLDILYLCLKIVSFKQLTIIQSCIFCCFKICDCQTTNNRIFIKSAIYTSNVKIKGRFYWRWCRKSHQGPRWRLPDPPVRSQPEPQQRPLDTDWGWSSLDFLPNRNQQHL